MKLLPKKQDIDKTKADERKREIDSGMALAKSIDSLRETKLKEEKGLLEWRTNTLQKVQQEIDNLVYTRNHIEKQCDEATIKRNELLNPLNEEWAEVNKTKKDIESEQKQIEIQKEKLHTQELNIKENTEKLSNIIKRIKLKESQIDKQLSEISSLKDLTQGEYEIARSERIEQTDRHEYEMLQVNQMKKEYQVASSLIEIREKEVNEKEADIINRELHLESQQQKLRVAKEILEKNATIN